MWSAFHRAFPATRWLILPCAVAVAAVFGGGRGSAEPADPASCHPAPFAQGIVASVTDGRTFRLRDGRIVRMAALELPPDATDPDTGKNPSLESGRALARLLTGRAVSLKRMPQQTDRYGRLQAFVFIDPAATVVAGAGTPPTLEDRSAVWLDEKLLADGMALRGSEAIDPGCHSRLIAAEAAGRTAGRGLWDTPNSFVRAAADGSVFTKISGHFAIAEGEIRSVNTVGSLTYLNFGRIWRQSLTAVVAKREARLFQDSGVEPSRLLHRTVRVRGWVEKRLGPTMVLNGPEQMEIVR